MKTSSQYQEWYREYVTTGDPRALDCMLACVFPDATVESIASDIERDIERLITSRQPTARACAPRASQSFMDRHWFNLAMIFYISVIVALLVIVCGGTLLFG